MKNIRKLIITSAFILSIGLMFTAVMPQTVFARGVGAAATTTPTPASTNCNGGFLGFPAWYRGLTDSNCNIKSPTDSGGLTSFIWHIALNILEMIIVAVAYLSGFYFLYGGWLFIIGQGKPESIVKAKSTMTMALIGLIVSLIAVALVTYIFSNLPKS